MTTMIDIHDLAAHLNAIRGMSTTDEILITDGKSPLARLVPLAAGSQTSDSKSSPTVDSPFADEWSEEEIRRAKEALASNQPRYTTEEVVAFLRAYERK